MKKYLITILIIGLGLNACKNANEKEIGEVGALLSIIDDTEKSLLSIDTSKVFAAKRKMEFDLAEINSIRDTLTKEEAFKIDDFFGSKKRLYGLTSNYSNYIKQIEIAKRQLINLQQDLKNGLIKKEDFSNYYMTEKSAVVSLNIEINKSIGGLDAALEKLELETDEIAELVKNRKQNSALNE